MSSLLCGGLFSYILKAIERAESEARLEFGGNGSKGIFQKSCCPECGLGSMRRNSPH